MLSYAPPSLIGLYIVFHSTGKLFHAWMSQSLKSKTFRAVMNSKMHVEWRSSKTSSVQVWKLGEIGRVELATAAIYTFTSLFPWRLRINWYIIQSCSYGGFFFVSFFILKFRNHVSLKQGCSNSWCNLLCDSPRRNRLEPDWTSNLGIHSIVLRLEFCFSVSQFPYIQIENGTRDIKEDGRWHSRFN